MPTFFLMIVPLFSIFNFARASASVLNSNLLKLQDWTYQWEILFDPDPVKQAQEVIFSRRPIRISIQYYERD